MSNENPGETHAMNEHDKTFDSGQDAADRWLENLTELSANTMRLAWETNRAAMAVFAPFFSAGSSDASASSVMGTDIARTFETVFAHWTNDPSRTLEAQEKLRKQFISLCISTAERLQGRETSPVVEPGARDKRFSDPAWKDNPFFDFLKQAYLIATGWATDLVKDSDNLDAPTKERASFYVKVISDALSPSNFLLTNPELLRLTAEENADNLIRGMNMLTEDLEAGHGLLKVRQTDTTKFKVGGNLAVTPGKVVFRNDLFELIQYAPTTPTVLKRPLLIVPPWINKYYILDLSANNSFIRWAVDQGLTVFCMSWVNPGGHLAGKSFADYSREGIGAALDTVHTITGEKKVSAIGYCIGGTLLGATLAVMAAKRDSRISSAAFFAAQFDFQHAGELKYFIDERQLSAIDEMMKPTGYFDGAWMSGAFNLLRSNDLIWPYMIDVYQKGKRPPALDLLFWNSDTTRIPAANHSFYLRSCYLENLLSRGEMELDGVKLNLAKIKIPIFSLATRSDHIAPARSVLAGLQKLSGPVTFVLAASGHIAGVINPPDRQKYCYWTGGPLTDDLDAWLSEATEHPGSWWPLWFQWLEDQAPKRVPARIPGDGGFPTLCDAPGTYALVA